MLPKIDWPSIAAKLSYASETAMWQDLYVEKHTNLLPLAKRFGVCHDVVRRALKRCEIPRRHGHRPKGSTTVPWPDNVTLQKMVYTMGGNAAGRQLGCSSTAIYRR